MACKADVYGAFIQRATISLKVAAQVRDCIVAMACITNRTAIAAGAVTFIDTLSYCRLYIQHIYIYIYRERDSYIAHRCPLYTSQEASVYFLRCLFRFAKNGNIIHDIHTLPMYSMWLAKYANTF